MRKKSESVPNAKRSGDISSSRTDVSFRLQPKDIASRAVGSDNLANEKQAMH
jgi:hypothetical protein